MGRKSRGKSAVSPVAGKSRIVVPRRRGALGRLGSFQRFELENARLVAGRTPEERKREAEELQRLMSATFTPAPSDLDIDFRSRGPGSGAE